MNPADEPASKARARSASASDMIFFGSIIMIASLIIAACLHSSMRPPAVDDVKLGDFLTISVGISGMVVPLIIAYLSSGRTADVFSEVGDAVPFFMQQAELMPAITSNSVLSAGILGNSAEGAFQVKLSALDEIRSLRSASGRYLSPLSKRQFVPDQYLQNYENFLECDIDRVIASRYIFVIGVPALITLILLGVTHYDGEQIYVRVFAHGFAIATLGMNGCGAHFFFKLSVIRDRLQRAIATEIRNFCEVAKEMSPLLIRAAETRSDFTASKLLASAEEIKQRRPIPD